jgi:iron(III) transport system substrate-binding protein
MTDVHSPRSRRRTNDHGLRALAWLVAAMVLWVEPAVAQPANAALSQLSAYRGADRTQRLEEGARKEGTLTLYTSLAVEDSAALSSAFEKKYGIKLKVWRASSETLVQRAVAESQAKRYEVDVFETDGSEMEALRREKLLHAVESPVLGDLMPKAVFAHREWVGSRVQVIAAGYNTKDFDKASLPRSYEDLLDPKWKGKLGIEA